MDTFSKLLVKVALGVLTISLVLPAAPARANANALLGCLSITGSGLSTGFNSTTYEIRVSSACSGIPVTKTFSWYFDKGDGSGFPMNANSLFQQFPGMGWTVLKVSVSGVPSGTYRPRLRIKIFDPEDFTNAARDYSLNTYTVNTESGSSTPQPVSTPTPTPTPTPTLSPSASSDEPLAVGLTHSRGGYSQPRASLSGGLVTVGIKTPLKPSRRISVLLLGPGTLDGERAYIERYAASVQANRRLQITVPARPYTEIHLLDSTGRAFAKFDVTPFCLESSLACSGN